MSIQIHPRSDWGAKRPKSRTSRDPGSLAGVAVHWFGIPKAAKSHDGCDALLRSVQNSHMSNAKEGFVDIAYNHAVCPHGHAYELRGFGVQTGANGTTEANRSHAAVVYMAGEGDPFTAAAKPVLAELIRMWRQKGAGPDVKPHGFFTGSSCPGPQIAAWIKSREFEKGGPAQPKPPVRDDTPEWLVPFIEWRLVHNGDKGKRPKGLPKPVPASAWEAAVQVHRIANQMGPQGPFLDWAAWQLAGGKKADSPRSLPGEIPKPWRKSLQRIKAMTGTGPAVAAEKK